jgi:predicted sugar kinase
MQMLPGIATQDIDLLGSAVNAVQGPGFKKMELSIQIPRVIGLPDVLREAGAAGAASPRTVPRCMLSGIPE